jgi:gamma-glutamylcyclotransferase (GGCT)/AIG2-like uncharacterized protein YtfP
MYQRVFVYGTLLREDIQRKVIGRVPASEPATLNGYRRPRMFDRPVIRPAPNAQVDGRILKLLKRRQLHQVDRYEGREYRRKRVRVRLPDGSHHSVWTYVGAARCGESW